MRHAFTRAEALLSSKIRSRQLDGFKFVRQEPIGRYFVDFVCRERRLVVEVGGGQHAESTADRRRDEVLGALGYRVVRVWNNEVTGNLEGVLEYLLSELRK